MRLNRATSIRRSAALVIRRFLVDATTGMGRSFSKAEEIPTLAEFFHAPSQRFYSVVNRDGALYVRRAQAGNANIIEKRIDFVVGSGNHSKSFVHRDGRGRLLELPISWYSERGGYWAMSPGYNGRTTPTSAARSRLPACSAITAIRRRRTAGSRWESIASAVTVPVRRTLAAALRS